MERGAGKGESAEKGLGADWQQALWPQSQQRQGFDAWVWRISATRAGAAAIP
jgi:hypothetical protein